MVTVVMMKTVMMAIVTIIVMMVIAVVVISVAVLVRPSKARQSLNSSNDVLLPCLYKHHPRSGPQPSHATWNRWRDHHHHRRHHHRRSPHLCWCNHRAPLLGATEVVGSCRIQVETRRFDCRGEMESNRRPPPLSPYRRSQHRNTTPRALCTQLHGG